MNYSFKLKVKQQQSTVRQQPSVRRIRTDYVDTLKKMTSKQPLIENKKILNHNQSNVNHSSNMQNNSMLQASKPAKKVTAIKSVLNKNGSGYSRLTTQPAERPHYLHHQRTATAGDKIGSSSSQTNKNIVANVDLSFTNNLTGFKKKQSKARENSCKNPQQSLKNMEPSSCIGQTREIKGENRYQIQKKVGSGTFGTVHKARDKKTLQVVAIKKVYQDKNYKNRELDILKILHHPNVLSMKDSFFTYQQDSKQYLNVVMDYYEHNLYESIQKYSKKNIMPRLKYKVYAYQLFRSLLYLKKIAIAHRDIKPQNILVNEDKLKLVMCDFGSAKQLKSGEPNIAYICSRCYRAPELIFGNSQYTTQIDMWSTGCVLAEMLITHPLFQGESNIDQLVEIIKVLGCPTTKEILEMNPEYDINKFQLPKINAKPWSKIFPTGQYLGDQFVDLMKNILCYSPSKRYTPLQALSHPFFNELRDEKVYRQLKIEVGIDDLFNFDKTKEDCGPEFSRLIPDWY